MLCKRSDLRQCGSVAVEFALVLPFLMLLVLGAIDWGYYFFQREVVVNSAREGARAGTLVTDRVKATADANKTATDYLTASAPTTEATSVDCAVLRPDTETEAMQCAITYPSKSLTGYVAAIPKTITARAQMRR